MKFHARDYQRRATSWIINRERTALWAEMGLGKTVSTLNAIDTLLWMGEVQKVLIIAPLRVAKFTWPAEVAKWDHLGGLEMSLILGDAAQRHTALVRPAPIHVINFENIPWLLETLGSAWPYDMVVVDESTKLKAHDSTRFRGTPKREVRDAEGNLTRVVPAKKGLRHVAGRTRRWVNLTGGPMPKGLHDLWSQTFLLDGGKRLGANISEYRRRFFQAKRTGFGIDYEPLPGAHDDVIARLQDLCMTLRAADWFDLPDLIQNRVPVLLPESAMADYRNLEEEFVLKVGQDGVEVVAQNAGVLTGKLRQFTAGAVYDETGAWHAVHDAKIEALRDVIDEAGGMPVLVIYHYQSDLARLQKAFPQGRALDKNPATLDAWNRGEIPIIFVHPQSAGHGLNMQDGSNIAVFFSLDWDLDGHDQVAARISPVRQLQSGHPRPVFIHYLMAVGTIDELILRRLIERRAIQDILMEAMKK